MVKNNKLIAAVLCGSLIFGLTHPKSSVSYKTIGNMYSRSFDIEESEIDLENLVQDKIAVNKRRIAPITMSDNEKRELIFSLLDNMENNKIEDDRAIVDLLEDLEFFYGQEEPLFDHFNRADSFFGQAVLAQKFSDLIDDIEVLEQRKQLLQQILSNEVLFSELCSLVQQLKDAEESYLSFFKEENPISKTLIANLYFGSLGSRFNANPVMLDCYTRLHNAKTAFNMCGDVIAIFFANYGLGKKNFGKEYSLRDAVKGTWNVIGGFYNPWTPIKRIKHVRSEEGKKEIENSMRDAFKQLNKKYTQEMLDEGCRSASRTWIVFSGLQLALNGYLLAMKGLAVKTALDEASQRQSTINYLHERLNDVASCVRGCKQLLDIVPNNAYIAAGLSSLQEVQELFADGDDDIHQLVQLLQSGTFEGDPSFFSRSGRVLAAYKLMVNAKDDLMPIFQTLGELDACLSLAKLYKEYQNENVGYAFAEYVESDLPILEIEDFWNPFIDVNKVVTNSIAFGESAPSTILITGTNMNGKSTVLKAVLLDVLMAQTATFAPAKSIRISPYSLVASYMNIKDDTAAGKSLFQAQVARSKELLSDVVQLPDDKHAFIAADELFTGTGADKAQVAAKKVVADFAKNDQVNCLCATHYPLMTTLADEYNSCKNCKMDMQIHEDGRYAPTYRLADGISECNIADAMVDSAFDEAHETLDDIKE